MRFFNYYYFFLLATIRQISPGSLFSDRKSELAHAHTITRNQKKLIIIIIIIKNGREKKSGERKLSFSFLLFILKYFVLVFCNYKENLQYDLNGDSRIVHDNDDETS